MISRLYSAVSPGIRSRIPSAGRTVYLTFDDGPGRGTLPIIQHLDDRGARATFFFTGRALDEYSSANEAVDAALTSGHGIGFHGYEHLNAWRHSPGTMLEENNHGFHALRDAVGSASIGSIRWGRPPYGRITPSLMRWYRRHGLSVALWDVDPVDYRKNRRIGTSSERTIDATISFIRRKARSGSIVLLHENNPLWINDLRASPGIARLLDALIADGWSLEALPDPGSLS